MCWKGNSTGGRSCGFLNLRADLLVSFREAEYSSEVLLYEGGIIVEQTADPV